MKLPEMKVCPKCGYIRKDQERAPAYECPRCGIIYGKYRPPAAPPTAAAAASPVTQPSAPSPKTSNRKPVPASAPASTATTADVLLLAVALGVLLEPVFGLTKLLKRLGVPGEGALSNVLGGRFFMVEVGVAGTLLSIVLAAVILFALGAQRSAPLSKGSKLVIAVMAINYFATMRFVDNPLSKLTSLVSGDGHWVTLQDLTLSLTMVVFGVFAIRQLIRWSRSLLDQSMSEVAE